MTKLESSGAIPSDREALVERFHDLAVRTQNPVYLWAALEQILSQHIGDTPATTSAQVQIPGWLASYLCDAAARINALATGIDYRKEPPPLDLSAFVSDGEPLSLDEILQSPELRQHTKATAISAPGAIKAIPDALGFVQGTKNSFSLAKADLSKMQEARYYESATAQGVRAQAAIDAIRNGTDARARTDTQLYARIREGKALL